MSPNRNRIDDRWSCFMTMEINSFLLRLSSNEKSQINRIDSHDMIKTVMLDIAIMQIKLHAELKAKSTTIIVTSLTRKIDARRAFSNRVFTSQSKIQTWERTSDKFWSKIGSQFLAWWALNSSTGAKGTLIKYFEVDRVSATCVPSE